tara:strand:+ start:114 stop:1922 length:1809 start_codon:yes stop_codon:yes gene_type:complete
MAAYKDLVGQKITKVTSNPGEPKTGQMWYNSTTGSLKGLGILEAWASASPLNTARFSLAGAGTQTAALGFGGKEPSVSNKTEEYNGSGWSNGGNLGTAVYILGGAGSQTAGLGFGGYRPGNTNATEEYDGSSWTSGGAMGTARRSLMGAGIQTAALGAGGNSTTTNVNITEEYNGSSWTSGGTMGTGRAELGGSGLQTAALAVGAGSPNAQVEEYDGSSWTSGGALNTGRSIATATGPQTANLAFGPSADCEAYDGTSWTAKPDMGTSRGSMGGGMQSPNTASIGFGGSPGAKADTEEFTSSTNTITAAAWASGGALSTKRYAVGGTGTQTAGLAVGGTTFPIAFVNATEEYGGASWTAGGNYPTTTSATGLSGTQTAAVATGGFQPGAVATTCTYDGSSWTALSSPADLNQARAQIGQSMDGTQTASIVAGGVGPGGTPFYNNSETWDGSSWTATPTISTARGNAALVGTTSAAAIAGGYTPSQIKSIEIWNGSSWTTSPATLIENNVGLARAGSAYTSSLFSGGYDGSSNLTRSQGFDGTTVSTRPSISTARRELGGCGTDSAALIFGGVPPSGIPGTTTATEEFTGETETANIADFTTS